MTPWRSADDLIESLRSGPYWSQSIRVDQEDRERVVNSAMFQDSLAIRAGLMWTFELICADAQKLSGCLFSDNYLATVAYF
jgi:hypothetical protein